MQIFEDAWDLHYLFAEPSPVFFPENGTPWYFLREKGGILGFFRVSVRILNQIQLQRKRERVTQGQIN